MAIFYSKIERHVFISCAMYAQCRKAICIIDTINLLIQSPHVLYRGVCACAHIIYRVRHSICPFSLLDQQSEAYFITCAISIRHFYGKRMPIEIRTPCAQYDSLIILWWHVRIHFENSAIFVSLMHLFIHYVMCANWPIILILFFFISIQSAIVVIMRQYFHLNVDEDKNTNEFIAMNVKMYEQWKRPSTLLNIIKNNPPLIE